MEAVTLLDSTLDVEHTVQQQCHNIELEPLSISFEEAIGIGPQAEFEKSCQTT